jgi:class 3 adenylate cyclase/tetratricopeptide (TPR) repeat protein
MAEREDLEQAIAQLEAQRATLGDGVVDVSIAVLREKLATLSPVTLSEQRKQITILFADVSGYTAMSETLDAEEVSEVMNAIWQRLDVAIVEHGGRIDKHSGDGVMALWGVYTVRESDPEKAIRAALAMQAVLAEFEAGHSLKMRIGLSTGPVLLGDVGTMGEFSAIGDAVNLASRMEGAAPPGGVLISHDTYRHVRGVFDVLEQEPLLVKGKAEPVQTYVVQRAKPRAFRLGQRGVQGIETRLIGRDAELLTLQNLFRCTTEDAETHIVTVVGDAGVGKSRLLYEFENWLELLPEEIWFFKGRATPETEAMPYSLIHRMFAHRFEILDSDSVEEVWGKFRAGLAAALKPDQADLVGQLIGFDFSASQMVQTWLGSKSFGELAMAYLTEYLRAMASEPTVIFLEDIHWADDRSLDLLDYLVAAVPGTRLLVVCLARPPLFERRPGWGKGEGQEMRTQINLKPLSHQDSRALVGEILRKAGGVPHELRDLIVEGAEGNPLYVEELIKMLIEDDVIVPGEDRWRIELGRQATMHVPPTLTGLLQARLDSLPRREKGVLQRASVVGRLFWGAVVAELATDKAEAAQTDELLKDVQNRELIFRRERSAFDTTTEYIFKHALLQDVTYETVLLKLRRVYHAQVARWLKSVAGERITEYLSLIARHHELAGETAEAADFLRRLGEESEQIGAYPDAVRAFERALDLLPAVDPDQTQEASTTLPAVDLAERARLLVILGASYNRVGDHLAAVQHLEQGLALARQTNDLQAETDALSKLGMMASEQGTFDKAQRYLDEALVLAREQEDPACLALTLATFSSVAWRWGDLEQAEKRCHESLAIYRELDDRRHIARTLNFLGVFATLQENYDQAEQYYEQGLKTAREVGNCLIVADLLNNLGEVHRRTGNLEKAKRYFQESLLHAREAGHRHGATSTLGNLGHIHLSFGEHQVAWEYFREALIESVAIGAFPLTLNALVGVVEQQIEVGQHLSAAVLLGLALSHPAMTPDIGGGAESALGRLRELLPAEQLEAAMAHGKTLELDAVVAELEVMGELGHLSVRI